MELTAGEICLEVIGMKRNLRYGFLEDGERYIDASAQ